MSASPPLSPLVGVIGTISLLSTTAIAIGAALFGTPSELGISLVALVVVVAVLWRWVR